MHLGHNDFYDIHISGDKVMVDGALVATLKKDGPPGPINRFRNWIETFSQVVRK